MNMVSKYDCLTWCNQTKIYCQRVQQKISYQLRLKASAKLIKKINSQRVIHDTSEIRLFAIMRNESLRLSHFIEYYKNLGVDSFFIIDNNSIDSSVTIALSYENVHVFKTGENYKNHWYWMEYLLNKYRNGNWCLVVDVDELLYFPHAGVLSIQQMCWFLEDSGYTALRSLLLDMYSDQAVRNTVYIAGKNPLNSVPYFDVVHYEVMFPYFDRSQWKFFESTHFTGGMRERVFGKSNPITSLNKFSLFKNMPGIYLGQGMHAINGAKVSDLQGVVFHTKFLGDCIQEAQEESAREQHFNHAAYYKDFKRHFNANPDLCLATSNSVRFQDSAQLVDLGLMKTNERFDEFARKQTLDSITRTI